MPSARRRAHCTTVPGRNGDRARISRSNPKPDQQLGIGYFAALLGQAWKIYIVRSSRRDSESLIGEARAMIFRQLFDSVSGTYTYILASRRGGEALIIDPVLEKVDRYIQLVDELDLKLVKAVDTHLHADHITGLGALR